MFQTKELEVGQQAELGQGDHRAQGEVHQPVAGQALHLLEQLESATYQVEYFGKWFEFNVIMSIL